MLDAAQEKSWSAEELGDRIFESCNAAFDVYTMHLGRKLGLYEALKTASLTSRELADRTGTTERYIREWLEQQAVTGILEVDDHSANADERTYTLPEGYAEVLTDRDSLWYFGPATSMTAAAGVQLPALAQAFRSGGGVSWEQFGEDMRIAQGEINRPLFLQVLAPDWLASHAEIHALLRREGATVADIGSGLGWSAIGIAKHYPNVRVTGFDVDQPSVDAANANAAELGVSDRVTFERVDPGEEAEEDVYDVVIACECLHDMSDPVSVLAGARKMVKPGGAVLILDERTHDEFTIDAGDMERFLYGFSVTTCLPDGLSHEPSVGTGTVMRKSTLDGYARSAGFDRVEDLAIEHEQFRLYQLI
ncbi:MAG: class I SAM-dependent methyltransferase [Acidimicrobiia bacterium]|nr:MAG: class I SAM-dependent methyltransferase [Acidimicrobiia bacterium]